MAARIGINDEGRRVGEGHHNSTISDETVKTIRDLRELHHMTLPEIARKTGVKYCTVVKIVYYQRRAQVPTRWKSDKHRREREVAAPELQDVLDESRGAVGCGGS